jgi:hypothetical protein
MQVILLFNKNCKDKNFEYKSINAILLSIVKEKNVIALFKF